MNDHLERQVKNIPPSFLKTPGYSLKPFVYNGPSMNPSLKSPCILHVLPSEHQKIKCGDVIVFSPRGIDRRITHRVISIDPQGIRTRGDNNNHIDPWILSPDEIIGHVAYAKWGKKRRRIYGGKLGSFYATWVRIIHTTDRKISKILRPAYRRLAESGMFRQLLPSCMKPRILSSTNHDGTEMKLLMGNHVIGRRLAGKDQWWIKRPFRLFIDESSLP